MKIELIWASTAGTSSKLPSGGAGEAASGTEGVGGVEGGAIGGGVVGGHGDGGGGGVDGGDGGGTSGGDGQGMGGGADGEMHLLPQSLQSLPNAQWAVSESAPPSSQWPSLVRSTHVSLQRQLGGAGGGGSGEGAYGGGEGASQRKPLHKDAHEIRAVTWISESPAMQRGTHARDVHARW